MLVTAWGASMCTRAQCGSSIPWGGWGEQCWWWRPRLRRLIRVSNVLWCLVCNTHGNEHVFHAVTTSLHTETGGKHWWTWHGLQEWCARVCEAAESWSVCLTPCPFEAYGQADQLAQAAADNPRKRNNRTSDEPVNLQQTWSHIYLGNPSQRVWQRHTYRENMLAPNKR